MMHHGMNLYYYQLSSYQGVREEPIYFQAVNEEEAKRRGDHIQAALDVSRQYEHALSSARQFVADAEKTTVKELELCGSNFLDGMTTKQCARPSGHVGPCSPYMEIPAP